MQEQKEELKLCCVREVSVSHAHARGLAPLALHSHPGGGVHFCTSFNAAIKSERSTSPLLAT